MGHSVGRGQVESNGLIKSYLWYGLDDRNVTVSMWTNSVINTTKGPFIYHLHWRSWMEGWRCLGWVLQWGLNILFGTTLSFPKVLTHEINQFRILCYCFLTLDNMNCSPNSFQETLQGCINCNLWRWRTIAAYPSKNFTLPHVWEAQVRLQKHLGVQLPSWIVNKFERFI